MTFNSVLGGSEATSYISVATADAIWANTLNDAAWTALTEPEKLQSLMASTDALEALRFSGIRCAPSTNDANLQQSLQWPRHSYMCKGLQAECGFIPRPVAQACAYLALNLYNDPNAIIPGVPSPTPARGAVQKQKLGDLEQTYFAPSDAGTKISVNAPIVLQKFPWLVDVLSCWLEGSYSQSGIINRVRS
tara:strand:+ start:4328 stop:4900 length:573 start_codon:yes stop_codon:yes gene_type:complete